MKRLAKSDIGTIKKLRRKGLGWDEVARQMHRGHHTVRDAARAAGIPGGDRGRPLKISDHRKVEKVEVVLPDSPAERMENLLIFDARGLDKETFLKLRDILPRLVHISLAWKAMYLECGCISCHKKRVDYASGGFCSGCQSLIFSRIRRYRKQQTVGRNLPAEIEAFKDGLALSYNAAQRLLNGDE
jgi:hypothetical protein